MEYKDVKIGKKVEDYLDGEWRIGKIIKKLKTRVHIQYSEINILSYDKNHLQFLKEIK